MKIHRWHVQFPSLKLGMVFLTSLTLLCSLGCWQLSRYHEKKNDELQTQMAGAKPSLSEVDLLHKDPAHFRFYGVKLTGQFINEQSVLLDNKTYKGQVGYHILTPFRCASSLFLVNRGWIPLGPSRQILPDIPLILGTTTIEGFLDITYRNPFISKKGVKDLHWPTRLAYIDFSLLEKTMHHSIYPLIVVLGSQGPIERFSSERHLGYAFQWFALAITLLILSFTCCLRRTHPDESK